MLGIASVAHINTILCNYIYELVLVARSCRLTANRSEAEISLNEESMSAKAFRPKVHKENCRLPTGPGLGEGNDCEGSNQL